MENCLTGNQISQFRRDGVLIIRNFYRPEDIEAVQRGIHAVIGQVMIKNGIMDGRRPFAPGHFDEGYQELLSQDRAWAGEVYDAVKQIPAFVRMVAHPVHEELMRELREGAVPGIAAGGYGIRIDNPFEDKFRAMWHQEYPAQLRSVDGLVFWSPLVPVTEEVGPVALCPGSQREGPLPVYTSDPDNSGRSGAYALSIKGEKELLAKYTVSHALTDPGDLVVIDFLTLHASGFNRSNRPRWSMQFRYFNFADHTGRSYGWKGSYAAGVDFSKIHPELYAD